MKDAQDISAKAQALRVLMEEKFRFKSRDLAQAVRKAGRRLPKRQRRHVLALVEAEKLARHPKLAVQIDARALGIGAEETLAYLRRLDTAAQRRNRRLDLAALVAFYVLITLVVFVLWLWWAGYV